MNRIGVFMFAKKLELCTVSWFYFYSKSYSLVLIIY